MTEMCTFSGEYTQVLSLSDPCCQEKLDYGTGSPSPLPLTETLIKTVFGPKHLMRTADSSEQLATLQRNTKWREKNAMNGGKRSSLTFLCQPLPKSPSSAPREIHSARVSLRGKGE